MRGWTQDARIGLTRLEAPALLAVLVFLALSAGAIASGHKASRCGRAGEPPRTSTLHQMRTALLCLVDRARERRGIPRLRYSAELRRAATGHSNDMVKHHYLSHDGSHGSSPLVRVARTGYLARAGAYAVGENIGGGPGRYYGSPIGVFRMWMHSPGHRANMLDPRFREFGIGAARGFPFGGGHRAATYTLDLAVRR